MSRGKTAWILWTRIRNEFQTSCVKYISGFVQRKLSQKLKYKTCIDVITSSAPDRDRLGLTFMKDRGGLTYASHELSKVAEIQGVPRNMTVGKYFKMSSSIIF